MGILISNLWRDEDGQDIAEYAVMLAVILVIVVGTIRLIGPMPILSFQTSRVPCNSCQTVSLVHFRPVCSVSTGDY